MASAADRPKEKNVLEKLLGLFADIEPGEGVVCILMLLNVFLLLMSYYVLKVVRERFLLGGGSFLGFDPAELKQYASGAMAVLLVPIIAGYGALANRLSRVKLINTCLFVVMGCLGLFFVLGNAGVYLGLAFFVWLGIVNVFLISQFFQYANDIYTKEQGKRLFAILGLGASIGAIVGGPLTKPFEDAPFLLLVVTAGIIAVSALLYNTVNRLEARRGADDEGAGEAPDEDRAEEPEGKMGEEGGFSLILKQRYLIYIALMVLLANLVNTTGEFILSKTAVNNAAEQVPVPAEVQKQLDAIDEKLEALPEDPAKDPEREALQEERDVVFEPIKKKRGGVISGFYADFFFIVNILGFVIQAFAVSRIFKYMGVRAALFFLPIIALGGYFAIAAIGGLLVVRVAKTCENGTDYSLQNTVKQALFLPTTREVKYKAKAAIDTFFVRTGDVISALVVFVGLHLLMFKTAADGGIARFALVNVGLVALWILLTVLISREHKKLSGETDHPDDTDAKPEDLEDTAAETPSAKARA